MTDSNSPVIFSRASLTLFILVALAVIAGAVGGVVTAGMFASMWIPDEWERGPQPRLQRRKRSSAVTGNGKLSLSIEPVATTEVQRDNDKV